MIILRHGAGTGRGITTIGGTEDMPDLKGFYAEVGGSYDAVLQRLPMPGRILRFIEEFVDDPSYEQLRRALDGGDRAEAFRAAHALKGVAANLGFETLADASEALIGQLRGEDALPSCQCLDFLDEAY